MIFFLDTYFGVEKRLDRAMYRICKMYFIIEGAIIGSVFLYFMRPRAHDNLYEFYGGTSIFGKSAFSFIITTVVCSKYTVMSFFVFVMFFCGVLLDVCQKLMM